MVTTSTAETLDNRPNVLIADDEEPVRSVLITYLNRMGYRTTAVENGFQALEQIRAGGVDLVISDYSMPILNGLEFYDRMVLETPELADKFILITGTAFAADVRAFVRDHKTPFLEKPFRLPELASMVEKTYGQSIDQRVGVS
ncbi:MAG: response regulator [Candidatus Omnitrophica bacterium]|nr:response regulator [Candidatus Omnitrophota bacterium]